MVPYCTLTDLIKIGCKFVLVSPSGRCILIRQDKAVHPWCAASKVRHFTMFHRLKPPNQNGIFHIHVKGIVRFQGSRWKASHRRVALLFVELCLFLCEGCPYGAVTVPLIPGFLLCVFSSIRGIKEKIRGIWWKVPRPQPPRLVVHAAQRCLHAPSPFHLWSQGRRVTPPSVSVSSENTAVRTSLSGVMLS